MRSTSLKRWAILIVVFGLIVGTGFLVQRFQISRLAQSVANQADSAAKGGDFQKAEKLYGEHLAVVPDDVEIQIKYADMLVKADSSPNRQAAALQIYADVLRRYPGREDVRRRQMELKVAVGRFRDEGAEADLRILLDTPKNKTDGNLLFLMGRCCDDGKKDLEAKQWYEAAIKANAPQKIDAYQRLATLLRQPDRLNQPEAADQAIDAMVRSSPENYLVYLARGRYRRQFRLKDSKADFEKALKLADDQPQIFLEMAKMAELESGYGEARKIFDTGLKKLPGSVELYENLADIELRTGNTEKAVETLERGLKSTADQVNLRWMLANVLAVRGDTGKLLLQIEELKNVGYHPTLLQFLTANYYVNSSQFRKARQVLVPLESLTGWPPHLKARVNDLLARCYSQLGEPGMQREAYLRALSANPQDVPAKLGLIDRMAKQGDIDGAINEYRLLVKRLPRFGLPLVELLIARNRQRPAPQGDWSEVKSLIDDAEKTMPGAVEPLVLRAEAYVAQGKRAEARDELEKARSRFPKSVVIRCAQANMLGAQKQFNEAQNLLDEAQKQLGDSVELRLQRTKLLVAKGGPQVVDNLNGLSENIEPFSKADRRKLLGNLATEFLRLQDLQGASRLWSRLAEQEPNDLELRLSLLDLAFQTANSDQIDKTIKQIEQIEGNEGSLGSICQVQYLIWQAERAIEKEPQEALRLRTKARVLLNELVSRRADWSAIPVALAQLEQQELRQGNLTAREIQAKEESIIRSYRRAIDLGQRSSAIVRETVKLLFKHKRGSEALDLVNSIPVEAQLASDLGRQAISFALENRDFERAEEIARKAVAAKPADFPERIWLAQILLASERQAEAETVIREAVDFSKSDPDRWITLVKFMILTKQPAKAAKVVKDAEAILPQPQAPLALAQCCELVGKAYEGVDESEKKQWYAQAKGWYEKAQAAHPDDLSIVRRLTEFFVQTKQIAEVEVQLNAILKRGVNAQSAQTVAWAKRTLALTLASSSDPQRVRNALSILAPAGPTATGSQGAKEMEDPEDLRALARVLDAQRSVQHRKRAIEVLESLVGKNLANTDDRFLLARLEENSGDWPKALDVYRDLNLRTKNPGDLAAPNRRSYYLVQFATSLLRNHKAGNEQELTDVQNLVDELTQRQPDSLETLALRVEVCRARNRIDKAVELIQESAHRPNLTPAALKTLAMLAEKLDRIDIAEPLYRQYAAVPTIRDGTIALALFLSRHGRVKNALDVCEPLWGQTRNPEAVAAACLEVVTSSNSTPDPVQLQRVSGWLEQAIKQKADSTLLLLSLANCREQQSRYDEAKALYQSVIKQVAGNAIPPSDTNNMIATSYNNLAWLMALKDGQGKDALVDINRAIDLVGPQPDFLDTRGVIHLGLKQTRDAINDLETAVKNAPSPSKLFHLAQAYCQANDKEKAKQYLKEARARGLDPIRLGPGGLHSLEHPAYQKLLSELGLS